MSIEENLRSDAKRTAGDDTIVDVAIFHPRGYTAAAGAGAGLGSAAGGDSAIGSATGAAVGTYAGMEATGAARGLPRSICVAVSPEKVYLMAHKGATDFTGDLEAPFATLDRSCLGVEVHQRAMNRVVILHDEASDEEYQMEAPRVGPYHSKALVRLLMLSEEHHSAKE